MGELGRKGRCDCKVNWWMGGGTPGQSQTDGKNMFFPLLPRFVVINSLGILKGHSWVAAGPVFAQTGMMSAYHLWSSMEFMEFCKPLEDSRSCRSSPGCWPALWSLNPTWTLHIATYLFPSWFQLWLSLFAQAQGHEKTSEVPYIRLSFLALRAWISLRIRLHFSWNEITHRT